MQIGILEPDGFSAEAIDILQRVGNVSTYDGADLNQFLFNLEAVFIRLGYMIDKEFLDLAPKLRFICSPATGLTHLDQQAISQRGLSLLTLKGEKEFLQTIRATPEHTFGLLLALLRNYPRAFAMTAGGVWNRDECRGVELAGRRVGIVGLGRVGTQVAKYCDAFDADVSYYDPDSIQTSSNWRQCDDLKMLIKESQIIILCANYNFGQEFIFSQDEIALMVGKYFINTARGELVEERCLLEAIRRDKFAGVAVDVIVDENKNNRLSEWAQLMEAHNVIVTPHIGGATFEAMAKTEVFIARKLRALMLGN